MYWHRGSTLLSATIQGGGIEIFLSMYTTYTENFEMIPQHLFFNFPCNALGTPDRKIAVCCLLLYRAGVYKYCGLSPPALWSFTKEVRRLLFFTVMRGSLVISCWRRGLKRAVVRSFSASSSSISSFQKERLAPFDLTYSLWLVCRVMLWVGGVDCKSVFGWSRTLKRAVNWTAKTAKVKPRLTN